ncbi:hypothetical protein [Helicobacter sp. MIT 03-1614]|nr:hypothetical protein [Helicobacter sp. MIT 03-1614]
MALLPFVRFLQVWISTSCKSLATKQERTLRTRLQVWISTSAYDNQA